MSGRDARRGQALVEIAVILPVALLVVFGVIGVGRLIEGKLGVAAVARECARAAVQANGAGEAMTNGYYRAGEVASGYGLDRGALNVVLSVGAFRDGATVTCTAFYTVELSDLPLLDWATASVSGTGHERIDRYRSRWR